VGSYMGTLSSQRVIYNKNNSVNNFCVQFLMHIFLCLFQAKPVNKDRFISKMFLRGDSVILVLRNPLATAGTKLMSGKGSGH
jgi:hypothetical protein